MKLTERLNGLYETKGKVEEAKYSVTIPYQGKTKSVEVSAKSSAEAFNVGAKEMGVDHKNPTLIKLAKIKKISEENISIDEGKSAEASMVLKLMDSGWDDELSFQKLVEIISIATGTDKKKLAKELDQYV